MRAYKLFRKKKNGALTSLFINKTVELPINQWMPAESHPTKGYALRPAWHCCMEPKAPHLSNKGRVWCLVEMRGYEDFPRPEHQGNKWYLAQEIRIIMEVS